MVKNWLIGAGVLALAMSVQAAPGGKGGSDAEQPGMFGVGASVGSFFTPGSDAQGINNLRINIRPMPSFALTLGFGYGSTTVEVGSNDAEQSTFQIIGQPKYVLRENNAEMQIGALIGYNSASSDHTGADGDASSLMLGLSFGGEYFFSRYFSIGSEIQAIYETGSVEPDQGSDYDVSGFATGANVNFNCYF